MQSQTVIREKLRKTLSYKKADHNVGEIDTRNYQFPLHCIIWKINI